MVNKTKPPQVENKKLLIIPYVVASLLVIMSITQLTNFEVFVESLNTYTSKNIEQSTAIAILTITLEIFAIPALIRLWISPLARLISSLFIFLAPFTWFVILSIALLSQKATQNIGVFGEYLEVPLSPSAMLFSLMLLAMSACSFVILNLKKECRKIKH